MSMWSDHEDEVKAVPAGLPPGFVSDLVEEAERRRLEEESKVDERCWACTRRKGIAPDGRAPLCLRHYVKLRLRVPSQLLDEDKDQRR